MKAIPKPLVTWFLSLFNVGMYSVSDGIDSLVMKLNLVGLSKHADTILTLSQTIEYQQSIMLLLDSFKCVCMVISLILLVLANKEILQSSYQWLKNYLFRFYLFLGRQFKCLIHFFKNLF